MFKIEYIGHRNNLFTTDVITTHTPHARIVARWVYSQKVCSACTRFATRCSISQCSMSHHLRHLWVDRHISLNKDHVSSPHQWGKTPWKEINILYLANKRPGNIYVLIV